MSNPEGAYSYPSPFRRLVIDLMHFSSRVPGATIERMMPLESLVVARKSSSLSPTWSALFTKAFAMVSRKIPALRTTFLTFPTGRYYLHPDSIATINVSRVIKGEPVLLLATIPNPDSLPPADIDPLIRGNQERSLELIPS